MTPRVLHVVSELYPFVKTGGLADVAAALPGALVVLGIDVRVLVPGYPAVLRAAESVRPVWEDANLFGAGPARLVAARLGKLQAYVLECPGLYDRTGGPYADERGVDWPDNARRFAALGWAARALALGADTTFRVDILQTHDWQAGMAIAYVKLGPRADLPCIATVHSIAYAGSFDPALLSELRLPPASYAVQGVEFYGKVSFLKAALHYADRITTVSPTYAKEIQEDGKGGGLEGLLRTRKDDLFGILNGVDYAEWSPDRDPHLPARYGSANLRGKSAAKKLLQERAGLDREPKAPLFGVVSRLVWQKGIDCLVELGSFIAKQGAELVVLGSGDAAIMEDLAALARQNPGRIASIQGFDEALSHLVQAGSDSMVVPSRSEPCGLTQLYALRYGSPPVVRRTGGLADTVVDSTPGARRLGTATGFTFDEASADGLRSGLARALECYAKPREWRRLQKTGMSTDFGWERSAREYVALYATLVS